MTSLYDKLNLRPGERRLVTVVAIAVFILLNAFFVWPHFGDWKKLEQRRKAAQATFHQFKDEVDKIPEYQRKLAELQQAGAVVASEDQASKLATTVNNQAALSGVQINRYDAPRQTASTRPNNFFDESRGNINVTTEEKALVDFLYNLGVGGSLIRVRSMSLNTDPARQKLMGNIELVASYGKKAPPKVAAAAPATTTAPATAPNTRSTNTVAKPNFAAARASNAAAVAAKSNAPTKK
jgi:hypothetical protein